MRVYVELPPGWGPTQQISTRWINAGYTVVIRRMIGRGEVVMEVYGELQAPG